MSLLTYYILNDLDAMRGERPSKSQRTRGAFIPCDVSEDKDGLYMLAELPGVAKDKISISVDKQVLTIETEKETRAAGEEEARHLSEIRRGKMVRSFELPSSVMTDSISCSHDNGVLSIRIKKDPAFSTTRKLEIN